MNRARAATDFTDLVDLAAERLGGAVVAANDEFFAPKEGLIKAGAPEWREGVYTERGKWMDGWETRRRRVAGYDWAIVRLGAPGVVQGVVIDTSFFTGNYPAEASLDALVVAGTPSADELVTSTLWQPLLERVALTGNSRNVFPVAVREERTTHLRLNIFPDGGVARLRVHGTVLPDPRVVRRGREADLAALENGGFVVSCSDMHYGHRQNLILPGRSTHMGDGWETRRRRGAGHEWSIVRLAGRGIIDHIELDTDHYRGNAPGRCTIECCDVPGAFDGDRAAWHTLVEAPLQPHARHRWDGLPAIVATHARLSIHPDGGVARLRLIGIVEAAS